MLARSSHQGVTFLLTGSEVGNVAEHIQHRDKSYGNRNMLLQGRDRVLDLIDDVERVLVSGVGEADVH